MGSKTWWRSGGTLTIAGGVLLLGLAVAISFWMSPRGSLDPKPITVWAELVEIGDGRLIVHLAPAPTSSETAAKGAANGKRLTVILTPNTQLTADYYVGDFGDNHRVHVQPLQIDKLRAGIRLKLTIQAKGGDTVLAESVSWPQSIRAGNQPTSAAFNTKIPPLISPP